MSVLTHISVPKSLDQGGQEVRLSSCVFLLHSSQCPAGGMRGQRLVYCVNCFPEGDSMQGSRLGFVERLEEGSEKRIWGKLKSYPEALHFGSKT